MKANKSEGSMLETALIGLLVSGIVVLLDRKDQQMAADRRRKFEELLGHLQNPASDLRKALVETGPDRMGSRAEAGPHQ